MSVKVGLISDVHATPAPLLEALALFDNLGVDAILCAGDIAGYGDDLEQVVSLLIESKANVILGNHDLWWLCGRDYEVAGRVARFLRGLPSTTELAFEGTSIYMVHASPPESVMDGIRLLDENAVVNTTQRDFWRVQLQDFPTDILIVGHTHQVFAEPLGDVLVINPGSTLFNHTCMVLTLPERQVQLFPLSGKKPVMNWNWGMFYAP